MSIGILQREICDTAGSPSDHYAVMDTPTMLVDDEEHIIAWYLPGLLSPANQVRFGRPKAVNLTPHQELIWKHTEHLRHTLGSSITTCADGEPWRTNTMYFRSDAELKGSMNISPGWFQQGYNVSPPYHEGYPIQSMNIA